VNIKGIISDLDGTVYRGEKVIPGAPELFRRLREANVRVVFISNKPLESREAYAEKLTRMGIPTRPEEVVNSSLVMAHYLAREMPGATVFVIGERPLLEELAAAGVRFSEDPEQIKAVIASFDRTFDYRKLNIAFQALKRGARFLATNADASCPVENGEIPDAGAVIGALKGCTGRDVEVVVGKPSSLMLETALEMLNLPPGQCLIVGDRLETDILMGKRAGIATALVLTGVTTREALARSPIQPDYVLESICELLTHPELGKW